MRGEGVIGANILNTPRRVWQSLSLSFHTYRLNVGVQPLVMTLSPYTVRSISFRTEFF